jgi:hypothetical protein
LGSETFFFGKKPCCPADDLLGYGKPKYENKWWFDLKRWMGIWRCDER